MEKILISACLLGQKVRYNEDSCFVHHNLVDEWQKEGRLIPVCPEVAGLLEIPRPPAEIIKGDGHDVVAGRSRILTIKGEDVTQNYLNGAKHTLNLAEQNKAKIAILKSRSPSCGFRKIRDGTFSGNLKQGRGVTAALLSKNNFQIFTEDEIDDAHRALILLESKR